MQPPDPQIPEFRPDGFLPEGVYCATEAEVTFRFGVSSRRRKRLILRLRRWIKLARETGAQRILVDGSFVTAKEEPNDIDAVVLVANNFPLQVDRGFEPAVELEEMLVSRSPEEIFAAEDQIDWNEWVEFFGRTRESDGRRKGLVEIRFALDSWWASWPLCLI